MEEGTDARTQGDPAPGRRVFGRYTLVRVLGQGGMGVVWLARDEELGIEVALKFVADHLQWDGRTLAALRREVLRSRQLSHPGIVRIHDLEVAPGLAAIAMEHMAGGSLGDRLAARLAENPPRALGIEEVASLLRPLAAALDYAHGVAKIVHRDLKPSNILLTAAGEPKISDFGVTRSLAESATRTSGVATLGTLAYMGPQQLHDEAPTPADDIYSLGATLYDLLAGSPPFVRGNVPGQIELKTPVTVGARRAANGIAGDPIPAAWEEAIAACLAKDPSRRPAAAAALVERLLPAAGAAQATTPAARPRRMRRWGPVAALVVTGMGFFLSRDWQAAPAAPPATEQWPVAAWTLDGDSRDGTGHGLDLRLQRAVPTEDRFGRIDRALHFNGGAALAIADRPELRWSGQQPFSLALWVRISGGAGDAMALVASTPGAVGEFTWTLQVKAMLPEWYAAEHARERGVHVQARTPLPEREWRHLAVVTDGREARLYVAGVEAAVAPLGAVRRAPAPGAARWRIGIIEDNPSFRFAGDLDDIRVWRRALSAAEIAQLAATEPAPRFAFTRATPNERDDLAVVVKAEFGPEAAVGDWDELRRWHGDAAQAWADEAGLLVGAGDALVQRGGRRFHDETRHYLITRFDGTVPAYYGVHAEMGGNTIVLGSWRGIELRVLARLPPAKVRRESLAAPAAGRRLEKRFPAHARPEALALSWNADLGTGGLPLLQGVELEVDGGRRMRAECRFAVESVALTLGAAPQPALSRQYAPALGPHRVTLTVTRGRLSLRAASTVGGTVAFAETEALPDFAPRDIAGLTLSGVGATELVIE